jgi:hypothetical protein
MPNPLKVCQTLNETMKRKACLCPKIPNLRLPGIVFKNGFFVAERSEEQDTIETDLLNGEETVSWLAEPVISDFGLDSFPRGLST